MRNRRSNHIDPKGIRYVLKAGYVAELSFSLPNRRHHCTVTVRTERKPTDFLHYTCISQSKAHCAVLVALVVVMKELAYDVGTYTLTRFL